MKSPKISALGFLFGLVAASWKYRITRDTFCCPTRLLPTKRLNRWSFEITMMSLRQWELKIHLSLSLVLKSLAWILFPAYLKLNYLWDLCSSSSGIAVLLPSVHGDPFWSKHTRSHEVQDGASRCLWWLDQLTLTFALPTYWSSFPLEPRFPNRYLDSCLTTSCVITCFDCSFTGFFTLSLLSINKVLRQPTNYSISLPLQNQWFFF